jgi:hypothetical protein
MFISDRRATVDRRGKRGKTVKVRVVARTTRGKTLRDTRTYRTCAARKK